MESWLTELAERMVDVSGVVGVVLGGSRARGTADAHSDVDLGLCYRAPLDVPALRQLAREVGTSRDGTPAELTDPLGWGPWVDGGGWLTVAETPVDWLYRDLRRVEASVDDALAGRLDFHFQVGHPFGVPSVWYAAELATGVVLADPDGEVAGLQARLVNYPPALAAAWVGRLDEAGFLLDVVDKPLRRGDVNYVSGCVFRVVTLAACALHAQAGAWVTHEKGVVASADRLFDGFAGRVAEILAVPDPRAPARALLDDVRGWVTPSA